MKPETLKPGRQPIGLTNASANLNIRCQPADLAKWREAATKRGESLSRWVVISLNAKAEGRDGK